MTEIQSSAQVHLDSRLNAPPSKRASVNGMQVVTYISKGGEGHHDDYYRLFAAAAIAIGVSLQFMPRSRSVARRRGIWFYSMFDTWATETTRASLAALFRSLVGKKTIGLLFRPGDCFIERSIKSSFRRILFGVVSRLRNVHLLSIFPFAVSPEISSVATSWIYEPQLWDLQYLGVPDLQSVEPLQAQIRALADKRRIVVALGSQCREKGFDYLVDLWVSSAELRASHLFVACGVVLPDSKAGAKRFHEAGGMLLDRHIDDAELFCLYRNADL